VEAERNIKSVVADKPKRSNFFVVVFTKSCINDYNKKKNHSNPAYLGFNSVETEGSDQIPLKGSNHGK
jgi:hypothetical protein